MSDQPRAAFTAALHLAESSIASDKVSPSGSAPARSNRAPGIGSGARYAQNRVNSAAANSAYPLTVEFFVADAAGQGRTFIHRVTYTTPQVLDRINFKPVVLPTFGDEIVATATDAKGNTSEFSSPIAVTRPGQGGN